MKEIISQLLQASVGQLTKRVTDEVRESQAKKKNKAIRMAVDRYSGVTEKTSFSSEFSSKNTQTQHNITTVRKPNILDDSKPFGPT